MQKNTIKNRQKVSLLVILFSLFGNLYSQINVVNELNFHLSEDLISLNDNAVLEVIDKCGFDSVIVETDTATGYLDVIAINPGLGYDTIIFGLNSSNQLRKLTASSISLGRRVEIIYFLDGLAQFYVTSDYLGMNKTTFIFDYLGRLMVQKIEDKNGCLVMIVDYHSNKKGSIDVISLYKNCAKYAIYVYNKRGKLKYLDINGNDNYPMDRQRHGYSFKKGKLIERKVTLRK
jgi:hypothetical protein